MMEKTMGILLEDRCYECSFFAVSSYAKPMEMSRVLYRLHYRASPPQEEVRELAALFPGGELLRTSNAVFSTSGY